MSDQYLGHFPFTRNAKWNISPDGGYRQAAREAPPTNYEFPAIYRSDTTAICRSILTQNRFCMLCASGLRWADISKPRLFSMAFYQVF